MPLRDKMCPEAEPENQDIRFHDLGEGEKIELLKALGYDADEDGYIVDRDGDPYTERYSGEEIRLENASILPGSTVIVDTNALSLSRYIGEYLDV
ncbi:MAG: hypothetical protein MAG715_00400 [Methanonatronarchaeales archaeon]|nr:hypothetical protein [Methanonatronarchaeales archaeon]